MSLSHADLHIHTTFSDGLLEPEDAVTYAVARTDLRVIAITDHMKRLVVDLAQVSFIDSGGIGAIVAAQKRARALGGELTLAAPTKHVATTLRLVHMDKVLGIYPTPPAAIAASGLRKAKLL